MTVRLWQEMTYPDLVNGCESLVIIAHSGRGAYHIRDEKPPAGKALRTKRRELRARLEAAIKAGVPPGEVAMTGPAPTIEIEDETWKTDPTKW